MLAGWVREHDIVNAQPMMVALPVNVPDVAVMVPQPTTLDAEPGT